MKASGQSGEQESAAVQESYIRGLAPDTGAPAKAQRVSFRVPRPGEAAAEADVAAKDEQRASRRPKPLVASVTPKAEPAPAASAEPKGVAKAPEPPAVPASSVPEPPAVPASSRPPSSRRYEDVFGSVFTSAHPPPPAIPKAPALPTLEAPERDSDLIGLAPLLELPAQPVRAELPEAPTLWSDGQRASHPDLSLTRQRSLPPLAGVPIIKLRATGDARQGGKVEGGRPSAAPPPISVVATPVASFELPEALPEPAARAPRRGRAFIAGAAALLGASLAVLAYLSSSEKPPTAATSSAVVAPSAADEKARLGVSAEVAANEQSSQSIGADEAAREAESAPAPSLTSSAVEVRPLSGQPEPDGVEAAQPEASKRRKGLSGVEVTRFEDLPAAEPKAKRGASKDEPEKQAKPGFLSVNSLPASRVFINGKGYGSTPQVNLALKRGRYAVVLSHPELGKRKQVVRVEPGKRHVVSVRF